MCLPPEGAGGGSCGVTRAAFSDADVAAGARIITVFASPSFHGAAVATAVAYNQARSVHDGALAFGRVVQVLVVTSAPVPGVRSGAAGPPALFAVVQPLAALPRPAIPHDTTVGALSRAALVGADDADDDTRLVKNVFRYAGRGAAPVVIPMARIPMARMRSVACMQPVASTVAATAGSNADAAALTARAHDDAAWLYWHRVCGSDEAAALAYCDWWRLASPLSAVF